MQRLRLVRSDLESFSDLDRFDDRAIFHTEPWLRFVACTQNAEPVVARVMDGSRVVGRFTCLTFKRFNLKILGSPFPGWTTAYMGFNLEPSVCRRDALLALDAFAFRDLGCVHFEVIDRHLSVEDARQTGLEYEVESGFEIDLRQSEETLFTAMTPACRRCVRRSEKLGVRIEQVHDPSFVEDYYPQLQDVFAKQQLVPTYSKARVAALIDHLLPTGQLLLVRALSPDNGACIATCIFPAMNDTMYFWGGASWRADQSFRPNEAIQWFAMRYWKAKGILKYDMGGGGEYKRKYGPYEIVCPLVHRSRYRVMKHLRHAARRAYAATQAVYGYWRR
jgi:hypothetical protein